MIVNKYTCANFTITMKKTEISVVLPFFNASQYLSNAIESVLKQTFPNFELILVNDGSTDNSLLIAENFALKDNRIRIINQKNSGMAISLNIGIDNASSDIIARMDGDDICHPDRFKEQFKLIKNMPSNSLVSSLVNPFSKSEISEGTLRYFKWLNNKISHEQIVEGLFKESPLIHPTVMFTKEAFYTAGKYIEYDGPEDYDLWLKMTINDTEFAKVSKDLFSYRIHSDNLSRNDMTHYGIEAFRKRQHRFLIKMINQNSSIRKRNLVICGAGKEGKKLCNSLIEAGISVANFIDVDPKKEEKYYKSVKILSVNSTFKHNDNFYLAPAGSWNTEEQLLNFFKSKSMIPLEDYIIL